MTGLYSHQTRQSGELLTANAYNGDHQAHIDGHIPEQMDDASADVSEMQASADPGNVGSEVLASEIRGELRRIRHVIKTLTGHANWYQPPVVRVYRAVASGHGQKPDFRTSDFTLSSDDRGKRIDCRSPDELTITIPGNASVALPIGYTVSVLQSGVGQVVFDGPVTIRARGNLRTNVQWSLAILWKRATDEWVLMGDLE